MDLLYNEYFKTHNVQIYNNLDKTNLENVVKLNKVWLRERSKQMIISSEYDQAPDRVAYDYYGDDLMYPVILEMNGISSMFNFTSASLNRVVLLPDAGDINKLLGEM